MKKVVKKLKRPTFEEATATIKRNLQRLMELDAEEARRAAPGQLPWKSPERRRAEADEAERQRIEELNARKMPSSMKIPLTSQKPPNVREARKLQSLERIEAGAEMGKPAREWRRVMICSFPMEFAKRCLEDGMGDEQIHEILRSVGIRNTRDILDRVKKGR